MTTAEKLYETVKDFPEPLIMELLDFAEFLKEKRRYGTIVQEADELLSALSGGLEDSLSFVGQPSEIQEKLRNEWD